MKHTILWFANNTVAANLLMICLFVMGMISLPQIRKELIPNVSLERINVQSQLPGGTVETVEASVCKPLENRLYDIQGISNITSAAYDGVCSMTLNIHEGYSSQEVIEEVEKRVDDPELLPDDASVPVVSEMVVRVRVMKVIVSGETSYATLTEMARSIRSELLENPEISAIDLKDMSTAEIRIGVPGHNLEKYNLSYEQIAGMIRQQTGIMPGGALETGEGEILITSDAYKDSVDSYRNIVIHSDPSGAEILLGDIATIKDTRVYSHPRASFDGVPSVSVDVYRVGDQNIMDIAAVVNAYVENLQRQLPDGLNVSIWQDDSKHLKDRIDMLIENAFQGLVLLFITLLLFLSARLSLWVSLGIPISFMGALIVMPVSDVSINAISLFAFILVLGIVVDDAVVVGESIFHQNQMGFHGTEGALKGVFAVYQPILFAVITSIVAFIPLLVLPGPEGKIMQAIPIVVIATLTFSLIESLWILPAHLATDASKKATKLNPLTRLQSYFDGALTIIIERYYTPLLRYCLQIKGLIITAFTVAFIVMIVMMLTGWIKSSLFTPIEADVVIAKVVFPEGTPKSRTEQAINKLTLAGLSVMQAYKDEGLPGAQHIYSAIGSTDNQGQRSVERNMDHLALVTLEMGGEGSSRVSAQEVMRQWRDEVGEITGVNQLSFTASLNPSRPDIQIELLGQNIDELKSAAKSLVSFLDSYAGTFDIHHSMEDSRQQAEIQLKDNAGSLGLTQQEVIKQINRGFEGVVVQRVQTRDDEVGIWLGLPEKERSSPWYLENMHIRYGGDQYVSLATIADVNYYQSQSHIKRYNRNRVVTVTAFVDPEQNSVMQLQKKLEGEFLPQLMAKYTNLRWSEGGQQRDLANFMAQLFNFYLLAILGMYLLMAVLFKSYSQPLLVLYAIPFGVMGAVLGHQLFGMPLTSWSYVGMVAVSGVVVNDNLVLMDHINNRRAAGVSAYSAVVDAGRARFRAIVLTSLTTFAGILPLLAETSVQAQFLIPMVISLGFGVLFATVISLLLVPVTYLSLMDFLDRMHSATKDRENDSVETAYQSGYELGVANVPARNPYRAELLNASWEAGYHDGLSSDMETQDHK